MSEFREIKDNIFALNVPFDSVPLTLYLVKGKETLLIDTAISSTPDTYFVSALEKSGFNPNLLINPHGHVDHFCGNAKVKATFPKTKLAIYTRDAAWAEDHKRHYH